MKINQNIDDNSYDNNEFLDTKFWYVFALIKLKCKTKFSHGTASYFETYIWLEKYVVSLRYTDARSDKNFSTRIFSLKSQCSDQKV